MRRQGILVSRRKKKETGPMPAASAGLLRFFEEETEGIKIRPELLIVLSVSLIVISVLAKIFFAG
jgi:preprotein translocase subunit Sec61beta